MTYSLLIMAGYSLAVSGLVAKLEVLKDPLYYPIFFIGVLIGLGLLTFIVYYLYKSLVVPMNELVTTGDAIANGQINIDLLNDGGKDELAKIRRSFNTMMIFFRETINELTTITNELATSSQNMASSSEEVNASSQEIASISQHLSKRAQDQASNINESLKDSKELTNIFNQKLNEIDKTTRFIEDISRKVNMLALNASIEAARAGEYGRGFAVVADNIRGLADETNSSVANVSDTISSLKVSLLDSINKITESIEKVSIVSQETASGAEQASASTEEQSATMEELTASSQSLATMATSIELVISRFQT